MGLLVMRELCNNASVLESFRVEAEEDLAVITRFSNKNPSVELNTYSIQLYIQALKNEVSSLNDKLKIKGTHEIHN